MSYTDMPDLMSFTGGTITPTATTTNTTTSTTFTPSSTPTRMTQIMTPSTPSMSRVTFSAYPTIYPSSSDAYSNYPSLNINGKRPGEPLYSPNDKRMRPEDMGQSGMGQEENIEGQLDGEQDSRQKSLIASMTAEQRRRLEASKDSTFARGKQRDTIQEVMRAVSGAKVSSEAVLVMGGITKVFVCEVIECARSVMEEWRESGPLRPSHLREAYRRLKNEGKIDPSPNYKKNLFSAR